MKRQFFVFALVLAAFALLLPFTSAATTAADVTLSPGYTLSQPPALLLSTAAPEAVFPAWTTQLLDSNRTIVGSTAAIPPVCVATPRIMPLGNSITYGTYGNGYNGGQGDQRPPAQVTGYRQPLYLLLQAAGRSVNFVGSLQAGQQATPGFDPNHEGHSGQTAGYVADHVFNWLNNNPAEVVLLHIGTNNINSPDFSVASTVGDVARILDEIDRHSKNTIVILALIVNRSCSAGNTNCQTKAAATTSFNNALKSVAQARIAAGDRIVIVDMEQGAGINYKLTPQGDMADELHPYKTGYEKMAAVWLNALKPLLPTDCTYLPLIQNT